MVQRSKLNGEKKTTHMVSLIGDKADDITQFIAKYLSGDKLVLIVDYSSERKILINAVGNDRDPTVILRRICYTVDEEIYYSRGDEFDVVLLYCNGNGVMPSLMHNSDYLYLCFGMQRYSMFLLEKVFYITNLGIPYTLVYRGVEDKKMERMAEDFYLMLSANKTKPDHVYFAPICEKDLLGLLHLEYNTMILSDLSSKIQDILIEANMEVFAIR